MLDKSSFYDAAKRLLDASERSISVAILKSIDPRQFVGVEKLKLPSVKE
jgi:hypothetical protein